MSGQSGLNLQQISPVISNNNNIKNRLSGGTAQQSRAQNTPNQGESISASSLHQQNQDVKLSVSLNKTETTIPESENLLNNERKRKERLANKIQMAKQQTNCLGANNIAAQQHVNTESMKRWTAEDDIALVAAVTHVS